MEISTGKKYFTPAKILKNDFVPSLLPPPPIFLLRHWIVHFLSTILCKMFENMASAKVRVTPSSYVHDLARGSEEKE